MIVSPRRNARFWFYAPESGVFRLWNHFNQNPIGTTTSNIIHDTPLITKTPRPDKGRVPSYMFIVFVRSTFFSGRLGCWLLFEISVRKSSSSPKRLLLQFTYDFPGFISCCITMLRIQPHSILCQLNSLMWAIDKTKWSDDKWPANRQGQPPPTLSIHHKRIKSKR